MKRKATATALVLFVATLIFVTTPTMKGAAFSTGGTVGSNTTSASSRSVLGTTDWKTQFTPTGTVSTQDSGTFDTSTGTQYSGTRTWCAVNTATNQSWFTNDRFTGGTLKTSTGRTGEVTGRFTLPRGTGSNSNFTDTDEFFAETNQTFNQFF